MDNLYVTLYTFQPEKNYQHNKNKVSSNTKKNFKSELLQVFLKNPDFQNFNGISELNIEEFFLIDYNDILHYIIIGNQILVPGWSLKIKEILEFYIKTKMYLRDQREFYLKDYTYWSQNPDVKPRRLRSLGGALRRIISLHKNIYYENFYNEKKKDIKLYTVFGNNKKLQATYLGVSQNKKIIKNKVVDFPKNKVVNFLYDEIIQIRKKNDLATLNYTHPRKPDKEQIGEIYKEINEKINKLVDLNKEKVIHNEDVMRFLEDVIRFLNTKLESIKKIR